MALFTERLIEFVNKYPILYDLTHGDYKNIRKKDKIWDEIGVQLDEENGENVKKKWKNLRDTYAKYLRSIKTRTGQAAKKNYKNWQRAQQMEYFKPYLAFAKTDSNVEQNFEIINDDLESESIQSQSLELDGDEDDDLDNNTASTSQRNATEEITSEAKKDTKRKIINSKAGEKTKSSVDKVMHYLQNKKQRPNDMDATELIFLGYAKTVKTFSPRRQTLTKMRIAQIIMEEELKHQDEGSAFSQIPNSTPPVSNIDYQEFVSISSPSSTANGVVNSSTCSSGRTSTLPYATGENENNGTQPDTVYTILGTYNPFVTNGG